MHLGELGGVNFWSLDHFDFSNSNILDGIDWGNVLGDLLLDDITGEQLEELGSVGLGNFLLYNIIDPLSDLFLLGSKSVVGLSLLVGGFPGESNHEDSHDVPIKRTAILDSFNKGSSLLNYSRELVASHVNTIEASEGITASGLINNELDFSPGESILVGGEI